MRIEIGYGFESAERLQRTRGRNRKDLHRIQSVADQRFFDQDPFAGTAPALDKQVGQG